MESKGNKKQKEEKRGLMHDQKREHRMKHANGKETEKWS